jgi:hypothetical protein
MRVCVSEIAMCRSTKIESLLLLVLEGVDRQAYKDPQEYPLAPSVLKMMVGVQGEMFNGIKRLASLMRISRCSQDKNCAGPEMLQ